MGKELIVPREHIVTLEELGQSFQLSFSSDILADPTGWTPEYPAFGHCSATAQIVNDLFGGEIYGYWFHELAEQFSLRGSHFLNVLPDGNRVDFTRSQFPQEFPYEEIMAPEKGQVVDRSKMFGGAGSTGQYARLHTAVTRNLWSAFGKKIDCPFLITKPWDSLP
jgi:hypothetical protein